MSGILMPLIGVSGQESLKISGPGVLSNLSLWYNASSGQTLYNGVLTNNFQTNPVTDGTEITKWKDISGVGADANRYNQGAATGPTYKTNIQNGLSALLYSSANKNNLDINPIGTWEQNQTGFTIYVVGRWTTLGASAIQIAVTDDNVGHQWTGSYWKVGAAGGVATAQSTTINTNIWTIHGMIFNGSYTNADTALQNAGRLVYRYNRLPQTLTFSANVGTSTSNLSTVFYAGGNNRNTPKSYMDGYLGEILIWTRAITATEALQVETYIGDKWKI